MKSELIRNVFWALEGQCGVDSTVSVPSGALLLVQCHHCTQSSNVSPFRSSMSKSEAVWGLETLSYYSFLPRQIPRGDYNSHDAKHSSGLKSDLCYYCEIKLNLIREQ